MKRFILAALAVLVVLFGLAAATRDQRAEKKVLIATRAVARYSVLDSKDVKVARQHVRGGDVLADATTAVGKAVLVPVPRAGAVPASKLVEPSLLRGRVPVTAVVTASPDAPGVGKVGDLVVSPRNEKGGSLIVRNVTVLAANKGKDSTSYTVGVTERERQELAPLLGFSDVRLTASALSSS